MIPNSTDEAMDLIEMAVRRHEKAQAAVDQAKWDLDQAEHELSSATSGLQATRTEAREFFLRGKKVKE